MSEVLMLIFTGVIAVSTVVYSVFSIRLWKATRSSVDMARYTAFMNLMVQLDAYVKEAKLHGRPEAVLYEQLGSMLVELGIDRFLKDVDLKNDKDAIEYFAKIEGMLRGHNIDPNNVPWFRKILKSKE